MNTHTLRCTHPGAGLRPPYRDCALLRADVRACRWHSELLRLAECLALGALPRPLENDRRLPKCAASIVRLANVPCALLDAGRRDVDDVEQRIVSQFVQRQDPMAAIRRLAVAMEGEDRAEVANYVAMVLQELASMNELFVGERVSDLVRRGR